MLKAALMPLKWNTLCHFSPSCMLRVQLLSHVQLFHDPLDCSPPVSCVHGISQNFGVGCHFLLQRILIQGSNSHPLHWQLGSLPLSPLQKPSHPHKTKLNPRQGNPRLREARWVHSHPQGPFSPVAAETETDTGGLLNLLPSLSGLARLNVTPLPRPMLAPPSLEGTCSWQNVVMKQRGQACRVTGPGPASEQCW